MEFTEKMLEKARNAKSASELLELAKMEGIALTEEEAADYFARLNPAEGELDDELDNVSGGGCEITVHVKMPPKKFRPGERVEVYAMKICPKCHFTIPYITVGNDCHAIESRKLWRYQLFLGCCGHEMWAYEFDIFHV